MSAPDGMIVEYVPTKTLKPAAYNPRRMTEKQRADLTESMRRFGFAEPIVVNRHKGREFVVVGGHQRLAIAKTLEIDPVPCVFVSLDLKRERELNLRLNRNLGDWDWDALADFNLDDLLDVGFAKNELSKHVEIASASNSSDDEIPPAPRKAIAKPGDVFVLGGHRVMCGDSTNPDHVRKLMGDQGADFLFTSPPYNVGVQYEDHDDATIDWNAYSAFLRGVVSAWLPSVIRGRVVAWNIGPSPKTNPFRQASMIESMGLQYVRTIIWEKSGVAVPLWYHTTKSPVARNFHPNYKHEFVFLFSKGQIEKGGAITPDNDLQHDVFQLHQNTATSGLLEDASAPRTGAKSGLTSRKRKEHPAPFPIKLPQMFASCLSDVGSVVADPFLGSGSTLIAAERIGRRCFGMEMSPRYVDVILERWKRVTGKGFDRARTKR